MGDQICTEHSQTRCGHQRERESEILSMLRQGIAGVGGVRASVQCLHQKLFP